MRRVLISLLVLLLSVAVLPTELVTVTVRGLGDIVGGRRDVAREKALEDAQRRAVEQAVGTLISAETLVQNGHLISDRIYKQVSGFVRSYEVINETIDEKSQLFWVTIKAHVLKIELEKSLRELIAQVGTIRVLFAFDSEPELVSALKNDLIKNGIQVIDPDHLKDVVDRQKVALAKQGREEAIASGLWFWARYVVRGRAEVVREPDLRVGNVVLKVVSYKYLIEVLDVTNAAVVLSEGRTVTNQGGTHEVALRRCVQEAIDGLLGKIPRRIIEYQTSGSVVSLVAVNAPRIREQLPEIPGITGLEQTEKLGDEERYQFRYSGDLGTLEKRIAEFGYEVIRAGNTFYVTPAKVRIEIQNATMADVRRMREELKAEEVSLSRGIVTCSVKEDPFILAERLEKMGYEIVELSERSITCQPKAAK